MREFGYNANDMKIVIEDALKRRSREENDGPVTLEGKVLATANALAHLQTDFYVYATWAKGREMSLSGLKTWVLEKAARDFNTSIWFDDVREQVRPDYERIVALYSR
jgi:hypothetical protein